MNFNADEINAVTSNMPVNMPENMKIAASPSLPWKTRLKVAFLSAITDAARRADDTVNRRLLSFFDRPTRPSGEPVAGVRSEDVVVDPSRELWFRLFIPSAAGEDGGRKLPVIIFFHGGGFTFMSSASWVYDAVGRRLSRKIPAVIVSVNYRLSPEHRFPAPYVDDLDVLRFLDDKGLESADLSNCFLIGDSAGGNIAHHVGYRAVGEDWDKVQVQGIFAIQPYFGGEERTESELRLVDVPLVSTDRTDWHWRAFLPDGANRDHEAVNVFGTQGVASLPEKFPAVAVVVGGFDPLQDWQKWYYHALLKHGKQAELIIYEKAIHGFYVFPELEESMMFIDEIRRFVEEHSTPIKVVGS